MVFFRCEYFKITCNSYSVEGYNFNVGQRKCKKIYLQHCSIQPACRHRNHLLLISRMADDENEDQKEYRWETGYEKTW